MDPVNFPGVIENIITAIYSIDKNYVYRQLNKQIYNETAQLYYETYKDIDITEKERINYYQSKPEKLGIIYLSKQTDVLYINISYLNLPIFNNDFYILTNNFLSINGSAITNIINNISVSIDRFNGVYIGNHDILITYHVYKNRTNLTVVNKQYAIEKTLDRLNNYTIDTFYRIYSYYHYIILNCFVFNMIDRHYNLLPQMTFKSVPVPTSNSAIEIHQYLNNLLDNPIDNLKQYEMEKELMLNEIKRLKPKLIEIIKIKLL